ncbi:TIGR01906 family membrane protein [Kocuria sp.]|uniref:TIGR01906 family membrane protein n=1 Tax=Kocuria sp. TaxID=1871328 RepID=UPI00289A307C|nr:TIGR01906 family membrane protein [Kocuria sp.]
MSSSTTAVKRPREAKFPRIQQVFLALTFPILLIALGVRLVATPLFLWIEYHRPGFPADYWGMSREQRMTYGSYGLDYIMNFAPPQYLGGLVNDDGAALLQDQEVSHMTDVQHVIQWGFLVALILLVLSVISCLYLHRRAPGAASGALFFGAWLSIALLVILLVIAVLAWETFFALFHSLFFDAGSWTFRITDTLIRLYPTQFWMDAAIAVALVAVIGAFVTMLITRPRMRSASRGGRAAGAEGAAGAGVADGEPDGAGVKPAQSARKPETGGRSAPWA